MHKNAFTTGHMISLKHKHINNVFQLVKRYRRIDNNSSWGKRNFVFMLYFCVC